MIGPGINTINISWMRGRERERDKMCKKERYMDIKDIV